MFHLSTGKSSTGDDVLDAGVGDDHVEAAEPVEGLCTAASLASALVRSASNGVPGAVGIGPEVDREHVHPVGLQPLGDRAADPARRAR